MTTIDEKQHAHHADNVDKLSDSDSAEMFTAKEARRIRRRIDLRLIPCLGFMYGISLMDRKNVSNAAIAGMTKDLSLSIGYRYSLITLSFFITYVLFQAPTTVICRWIGPRLFLPGICLAWGAVIIGFGFAKGWETLLGLRLILGVLEAGYFPGCVCFSSMRRSWTC
jgi:MFS family permease